VEVVSLGQVEGERNGKEIAVAVLIVGTRADAFEEGRALAIFTIQDMTGIQELLAFPESFARFEGLLKREPRCC